jgi:hypothetical protein
MVGSVGAGVVVILGETGKQLRPEFRKHGLVGPGAPMPASAQHFVGHGKIGKVDQQVDVAGKAPLRVFGIDPAGKRNALEHDCPNVALREALDNARRVMCLCGLQREIAGQLLAGRIGQPVGHKAGRMARKPIPNHAENRVVASLKPHLFPIQSSLHQGSGTMLELVIGSKRASGDQQELGRECLRHQQSIT